MKKKVFIRLIPVASEKIDKGGVNIEIPGTGQSSVITNEEFDSRFGNCIDIDTMLHTLKYIYNNTSAHADRIEAGYGKEPEGDEPAITEKEMAAVPVVREKLRRMKHQIDILEDVKSKYN